MQEFVVYNQPSPCPYIPGEVARLPLRRPIKLTPGQFDQRLSEGDRRVGQLLYRTSCPACVACEPIRIPIADFQAKRTMARTFRRGKELLTTKIGPPGYDDIRIELYNRHKTERGLDQGDGTVDVDGYYEFLVATCCDTVEFSYWSNEKLVAVAVSDRGSKSLNAVYCYFDPEFDAVSLGTYNVLRQIEQCRTWQLDYLYLGFYIAASPHMNYKGRFLPHERLIGGKWERFE